MILIDDNGKEWELVHVDSNLFSIAQPKKEEPFDLTPSKDGWNDPDALHIERKYRSIRIGDKFYGFKPKGYKTI